MFDVLIMLFLLGSCLWEGHSSVSDAEVLDDLLSWTSKFDGLGSQGPDATTGIQILPYFDYNLLPASIKLDLTRARGRERHGMNTYLWRVLETRVFFLIK